MTYKEILAEEERFKKEILLSIEDIEYSMDGVSSIGDNGFSVSILTLMKNDSWDPSYYSCKKQKEKICQEVKNSVSLESLIKKLNRICDKGTFSDGTRVNKKMVAEIETILLQNECRVSVNR